MTKKTIIYVDGYNLYYSRLKNTPFKWLDLVVLFRDKILMPQDPASELVAIKYFTSPVMASYARHGAASEHAQTQYLRALTAKYPCVEVIKGFHVFSPTALPTFVEGQGASKTDLSRVWMIEEKQTDVNLSLQVYRDVVRGICEQVVICSNDSDVEPVLTLLGQDAPHVSVGLVLPLVEPAAGATRYSNKRLIGKASWVRHHIKDQELADSQLPQHVPTKKKPASKPSHW